MSKNSQCAKIHRYLEDTGPITAKTAWQLFGCERLAARIHVLRGRGIPIKTIMQEYTNSAGNKVRYAVYSLEENNA